MGNHAMTRHARETDSRAEHTGRTARPAPPRAADRKRDMRPIFAGILVWMGVFGLIWLLD